MDDPLDDPLDGAMDEFGLAGLDLNDDWDPVHGCNTPSAQTANDRSVSHIG